MFKKDFDKLLLQIYFSCSQCITFMLLLLLTELIDGLLKLFLNLRVINLALLQVKQISVPINNMRSSLK